MAQYAMITEQGVNKINEAHALGEYIQIAYYVPVYDYRMDTNIGITDTSIDPSNIFTVTNSADTVPQGEVIWNSSDLDTYALTTSEDYLTYTGLETTATSASGFTVINFAHRNGLAVNTYKSSAIGEYYTANDVITPGNTGPLWYFSDAGSEVTVPPTSADGYGPQDVNNPTSDVLFRGVTYQPVFTSAGDDSRANFKVTINCPVGQIKFNKVGLYAVKRTSDGLLGSEPFLFAQATIVPTQNLYSNETGSTAFSMSEISLDFQIETKTVSADFENVFFSTSGDYWVRTTNESDGNYGLLYDGTVYVSNRLAVDDKGNFLNTSGDRGVSKVFISTFEEINAAQSDREKEIPQLALQYATKTDAKKIRTTFRTNVSGDCEIDMYGACLSARDETYSVVPAYDKEYGLGIRENRWEHLVLSNRLEVFSQPFSEVSASDSDEFYVKLSTDDKLININNSDLVVNRNTNSGTITVNSHYIKGDISNLDNKEMFVRSRGQDLIVTSHDPAFSSLGSGGQILNASTIIETLKGIVDIDGSWAEQEAARTSTTLLDQGSDVYVAGKKIYTYGNLIPMRNVTHWLGDWDHQWDSIFTKQFVGANFDDDNGRNIRVHANIIPNGNGFSINRSPYGDYRFDTVNSNKIGLDSDYVNSGYITDFFAKNIHLNSNSSQLTIEEGFTISNESIIPFQTSTSDLGSDSKRFRNLFVDNLILTNAVFDVFTVDTTIQNTGVSTYVGTGDNIEGGRLRYDIMIKQSKFTGDTTINIKLHGNTDVSNKEASMYTWGRGDGEFYQANEMNEDPWGRQVLSFDFVKALESNGVYLDKTLLRGLNYSGGSFSEVNNGTFSFQDTFNAKIKDTNVDGLMGIQAKGDNRCNGNDYLMLTSNINIEYKYDGIIRDADGNEYQF